MTSVSPKSEKRNIAPHPARSVQNAMAALQLGHELFIKGELKGQPLPPKRLGGPGNRFWAYCSEKRNKMQRLLPVALSQGRLLPGARGEPSFSLAQEKRTKSVRLRGGIPISLPLKIPSLNRPKGTAVPFGFPCGESGKLQGHQRGGRSPLFAV